MQNRRTIIIGAVAVAALGIAVGVWVCEYPAASQATSKSTTVRQKARSIPNRSVTRSVEPRVVTPTIRQRPPAVVRVAPPAGEPQAPDNAATPKGAQARTNTKELASTKAETPAAAGAKQAARRGKPPIQDPMARAALAFVGADPDAEWYWYQAINDPSLGDQERQDLIEDLNEDGLSDPHHPTMDDLPLILNRLALIEDVVWDAMDDVNADAFLEAYKDLVNLAFQAMENG